MRRFSVGPLGRWGPVLCSVVGVGAHNSREYLDLVQLRGPTKAMLIDADIAVFSHGVRMADDVLLSLLFIQMLEPLRRAGKINMLYVDRN